MTSDTPRTDAIKVLIRDAINETDRERQIALREGAECGIEQLERDLAAANAALRECRQHADVMADVPGSIAANLAAERYRAWRAKIDAAIAAKEKP